MSHVSICNLGVSFGKVRVLDDLSLEIAEKEFIVLLGPSGCGKSTLLNAIAGLQDIASGSIEIGGRDMTRVAPKHRNIAMVFQSYALYPRMTVRDNLGFGLRVAGVPKPEIARRVEAVATMLHLTPLLDRRPAELSGGQRQRVAIGRAVVREASVFLFDEPLSNLDAQLRAELRLEIKRLHQRLGATMIYVTHDQIEAMTLADRIAIMKDRIIQQLGTPEEIYARPVNTFVARFIGSPAMNFIDLVVEADHGAAVVTIEGARIALPASTARAGQPVTIGIRPEHVALAADDDGIAARIDVVENLGGEKLVWADVGGRTIGLKVAGTVSAAAGDLVRLRFAPEALHVFDAATGRRL